MKAVVVYYSYDGNCAFAAEQIAGFLKADVVQLQVVNEKKRSGFAKIFFGVMQVFSGAKPALKPYDFDAAAYDLIVLGSPVWAGSPSPAIKSFLSNTKINGKKIALFMCHAGGLGSALDKFRAELKDNDIVSQTDLDRPALNTENAKRQIEEWVKTFSFTP